MSSSELQYIVELSGQRLLPVPNMNNHTPTSNCLQTLKDRAHAWFKLNMHSFKTITIQDNSLTNKRRVIDRHFYSWNFRSDLAMIIPILPKPSQRKIKRSWSSATLSSVPHSIMDVLMDPAQNLIAVACHVPYENDPLTWIFNINLGALDGGGIHPQAAGRRLLLVPSGRFSAMSTKLECCGRHIALQYCSFSVPGMTRCTQDWHLHIWDWKDSMTSKSFLSFPPDVQVDFCFLGNDRLLVVVGGDLAVYSIEDMSQTPRLLACFRLPFPLSDIQCLLPIDHTEQMQMQAQLQTVTYTSDPTHQLLCLTASYDTATVIFIISTRIFFDLDEVAATMPKPWECWGPLNTRIFWYRQQCKVHVCGNRVLQAIRVTTPDERRVKHELRLMDFSPMAVTNREGLGRVVKEPSTIKTSHLAESATEEESFEITTSLPYIEVVLDRKINVCDLKGMWLDKDRIYLLNAIEESQGSYFIWQSSRLTVIEV
ncbi:uncharacterized protein EDB93DRAFT_1331514 [Suillus bovinus]|uniref:uncharacterized protein n=1 Tax=Suillus bovinus TaxID=48563 RepID=UPI001B869ED5|nr:uncharacterized protein EDB93DRAFT_1331514 [Suillus bovinus]KAG2133264.1 hypothetical protein EDB93DRAFT_1331514 [Suillus bovinus]